MKAEKEFRGNKQYVFRKELHARMNEDCDYPWVKEIDGHKVKVLSLRQGMCNGYVVLPNWCEEVEDEER